MPWIGALRDGVLARDTLSGLQPDTPSVDDGHMSDVGMVDPAPHGDRVRFTFSAIAVCHLNDEAGGQEKQGDRCEPCQQHSEERGNGVTTMRVGGACRARPVTKAERTSSKLTGIPMTTARPGPKSQLVQPGGQVGRTTPTRTSLTSAAVNRMVARMPAA